MGSTASSTTNVSDSELTSDFSDMAVGDQQTAADAFDKISQPKPAAKELQFNTTDNGKVICNQLLIEYTLCSYSIESICWIFILDLSY